jgi:hypothetical protein
MTLFLRPVVTSFARKEYDELNQAKIDPVLLLNKDWPAVREALIRLDI